MKCSTVHKLLNEYVENSLDDSVSRSLSEHIGKCRQCAAEENLLRSLTAALHSLPQRTAPLNFTDGVMESLSQAGEIEEEIGLLSSVVSATGLLPTWFGIRMMTRSVQAAKYIPRPTVRLRTGKARSRSLTKLPLALGFRW